MVYPSKEKVLAGFIALFIIVGAIWFVYDITKGNGRPEVMLERQKAIERKASESTREAAEEYERDMRKTKPEVVPVKR